MNLFYNDIPLHDYGQVVIVNQSATGQPEEAPQWWEHQLRVRLLFKEPTYADNYSLVQQVRQALKSQQQAVLLWQDDNGNDLVNQTATIVGHDRPESPNEKGTYFQTIEITFRYIEIFGETENNSVRATYTRAGAGTPTVTLGYVSTVKYQTDVRRYSQFRNHRESASGRLEVQGRFVGDPLATLAARRAALLAAADEMRTEVASSSYGRFTFGSINKLVRIEAFSADYDQHMSFIAWSLSAAFTEFPDESGYAQAEFTVDTRQDLKEGKVFLTLSGTIGADSEDVAIAKLATIRTSVAPSATWTMLRGGGGRAEKIDGEDGNTFIRLAFDEEFEKTISSLVEWEMRVSDAEDPTAGMIRRTYAGHVLAVGATFQTAYATATTKAKALGDSKHQFKLNGSLTCDDKQFSDDRQTSGSVLARVEFTYEYRLKSASRVYAEVNSEFAGETFGLDVETVSGFIVASTVDTARNLLTTIKNGYSAYMIRNERVSESRQKIANDGAPVGSTKSPPTLTTGVTVNTGEVRDNAAEPTALARGPINPTLLGSSYIRQWSRLDFAFQIHRPKSSASGQVAIRYEFNVVNDYIVRERTSTVFGTVWAASEAAASAFLDTYFAGAGLGSLVTSRRGSGFEKAPPSAGTKFIHRNLSGSSGSIFVGMNFDDTYVDEIDGEDGIIKCHVRETIKCSGPRVVVQPTASSTDVLQTECGTQSGRRTISGSVTATNQTICLEWIRKQRALPIGEGFTESGSSAENPPEFDIEAESIPLRDLYLRDDPEQSITGNAKFITVSFSFDEVFEELTFA